MGVANLNGSGCDYSYTASRKFAGRNPIDLKPVGQCLLQEIIVVGIILFIASHVKQSTRDK